MNSRSRRIRLMPDLSLHDCIVVEFAKLRRSLALLLCVAAPLFVAVLMGVIFNRQGGRDLGWSMFLTGNAATWAFFMLPMSVTALTVLVAQMEHGPRTWNHLLALPVPHASILLAKLVVTLALCAAMTLALGILAPLSGWLADGVTPGRTLTGSPDLPSLARLLARMFVSAWFLIALQLWAALRWRSFVPPLVLGIGGTFVAVAATGSDMGPYFPWLIPTNALAHSGNAATTALIVGVLGGAVCTVGMVLDTRRRLVR